MDNNLIEFIEKQGGVFSAAKYFGGLPQLKKMAETDNDLFGYLYHYTEGTLTFKSDNNGMYFFRFHVTDVEIDKYDDVTHLFVLIDLTLRRNKDYQEPIAMWVDSYCEDGRPTYYFNDPELRKFQYVMVRVDSVNGVKLPDGSRLDDMSNIMSDDEVAKIIKESVTECLINLQKIL